MQKHGRRRLGGFFLCHSNEIPEINNSKTRNYLGSRLQSVVSWVHCSGLWPDRNVPAEKCAGQRKAVHPHGHQETKTPRPEETLQRFAPSDPRSPIRSIFQFLPPPGTPTTSPSADLSVDQVRTLRIYCTKHQAFSIVGGGVWDGHGTWDMMA